MSRRRRSSRPAADMQHSATGQVQILDGATDDAQVSTSTVRRAPGSRLRLALLALIVVLVPAAIAVVSQGSDTADDPPAAEGDDEPTVVAADPVARANDFDELRAYGAGGVLPNNRYSEIERALDAVVVAGSIGDAQPLQLYGPAPRLEAFPPGNRTLEDLTFDASGNWLAGVYTNQFQQEVLMVGRIEGDEWTMDSVSVGILGFAWHPVNAGEIAFAKPHHLSPTITDVVVEDYTRTRVFSRRFRAEFPGRLRLWGDWGMAFDEPGPVALTTVATYLTNADSIGPTVLEPLVTSVPGRAMGELGPNRVLIDGADQPTVVNTKTAVFVQNDWIHPTAEVLEMASSPSGKYSVVLVGGRGGDDSLGGKVLLLAAEPATDDDAAELLFTTTGPTTFDWTPDGRFVAGYVPAVLGSDGTRQSAASVTVYDLDRGLYIGRDVREIGTGDLDLRFGADAVAFQETLND